MTKVNLYRLGRQRCALRRDTVFEVTDDDQDCPLDDATEHASLRDRHCIHTRAIYVTVILKAPGYTYFSKDTYVD